MGYVDGVKKRSMRTGGGSITPGGCVMLGQMAKSRGCNSRVSKASYHGLLSELAVFAKRISGARVRGVANSAVSRRVLASTRKSNPIRPPRQLKIAYLVRQYAKQ